MDIHIASIKTFRKGQTEISQQKQTIHQQYKSDKATNIIGKELFSLSPVDNRHHPITATEQKMEVDMCYESRSIDNTCAMMERLGSPVGMTKQANSRRRKQRSQRRGRTCSINVTNFEQASEFLHHFHAITSRSLDVIHESIDVDDTDESNMTLMGRDHHSPSHGLSALRRTKTCSCLLEAQTTATIGNHHGWFLEDDDDDDDDEWGFYSQEFDPSWSTSTRTVSQGMAPLRH